MEFPEGLPSWLVLVLFLLFGTPALFTKTAAKLPWVFGALARKWQSRQPGQRKDQERTASYERQELEIKRLGNQYDRISEDYNELNERVDGLERKLTETNKRFFVAIDRIRYLTSVIFRIDPSHQIDDVPEALKEYF